MDLSVLDPNSCDDHPPSDVRAGQALVLELYEALVKSPQWNETMLVIVYDEHGGFYDHVQPPAVEDDGSGYTTLGVRMPALVIGPRVKTMVCKQVFDHTALIKTILTRFAKDPAKAIAAMGPRVAGSPDLGMLLDPEPRDDTPDPSPLRDQMEAWRVNARSSRVAAAGGPSQVADGAGQELVLHDFQEDFVKFALAMREAGLPAGQP